MNVSEKHIVAGMVTDMGITSFDPTKVLYARNVRITTSTDKNELLVVTNEKSTLFIDSDVDTGRPASIVVGSAMIDNELVLFARSDTADFIYKIKPSQLSNQYVLITLFNGGNLGFSKDVPLETLAVYENEQVKKVYWVDGVHQLRCINVADESSRSTSDTTQFDACPDINLTHSVSVTKENQGGDFPAGTVQYAFTYHDLYGPETNVFEATPLYELSPKDKGVSADGRANCSFTIKLTNVDTKFDYIRAYAIIRTSENATPSVRLLGDYAITVSSSEVCIIDNGATGSSVDASSLIFIGGEPAAPSTFATKDGVLFVGNIKLTRPAIGTLIYQGTQTLAERIVELRNDGTLPLRDVSISVSNCGSRPSMYDYVIDNNRASTKLRRFKYGETYRLGLIAQYKTGIWSEVLWLGDYTNNRRPKFSDSPRAQTAGAWEIYWENEEGSVNTNIEQIAQVLLNAGYQRIAPVVVYPEGKDRTVFCQGIVSATVYNVEDRYNNKPFAQASWFFRPISEGFGIAASPHASLYPVRGDEEVYPVYGSPEMQLSSSIRLFLPRLKGKWATEAAGVSDHQLPNLDMVALCKNDYFVDTSIVTLNSPDIEFDDSLQQEDFNGLKFRIVGVSKSLPGNYYREMSANVSAGVNINEKTYSPSQSQKIDLGEYVYINPTYSFFGYLRHINAYNGGQGVNNAVGYAFHELYPWHKSGRICGQRPVVSGMIVRTEEHYDSDIADVNNTCVLNNKILSNIRYATTDFFYYPFTKTDVNADKIKLFDDTQGDFIPLGDTADSLVYYGNIDSIRTYAIDVLSSSNATHIDDPFTTKEVNKDGTAVTSCTRNAVRTTWYACLQSKAFNTKEPAGDLGHDGTYDYIGDTSTPEEILLKYPNYILSSPNSWGADNTPVPIKYKSTKHAVISLAHTANEIPSLYRNDALFTSLNEGTEPSITPFWDTTAKTFTRGKVAFYSCVPHTLVNNNITEYPFAYIGELYREFPQDSEQAKNRFGGSSDEALLNNVWNRCGDAVLLSDFLVTTPTVTMVFEEGDTYLTRYDCLKTYPYADDDVNSIVEILSTDIETRVNLDARYDNARGMLNNTMVRPENINLVNRLGYEQTNNFFTYSTLDYSKENINDFPQAISITQEKVAGSAVDPWMQLNLTAIQDLDGTLGSITALRAFEDNIYAFQENGFSQILFNTRVQISTSDGQPIEITNGMKLQGVRYLSNSIGCQNKWSICSGSQKLYWLDNKTKDVWAFSSQGFDNLSTRLGVKSCFLNAPDYWKPYSAQGSGLITLYDKRNKDLYFCGLEGLSLYYSESLDTFVSYMDYDGLQSLYNIRINKDESSVVIRNTNTNWGLWKLWEGTGYNTFFGVYKPFVLRFVANYQPTYHKVFDTVQWRSDCWDTSGKYIADKTFNKIQVWNQYQKSQIIDLTDTLNRMSSLKKKFNTFRTLVPRDELGNDKTSTDYRPSSRFGYPTAKPFGRIQGNYAIVELTRDVQDTNKIQFYDLEVTEFI